MAADGTAQGDAINAANIAPTICFLMFAILSSISGEKSDANASGTGRLNSTTIQPQPDSAQLVP